MRYLVIIERAENNFAAYSPDLAGCDATGKTIEEVEQNMREAIEFHLEGMRLHGDPIPEPSTLSVYVDVAAQRGIMTPTREKLAPRLNKDEEDRQRRLHEEAMKFFGTIDGGPDLAENAKSEVRARIARRHEGKRRFRIVPDRS